MMFSTGHIILIIFTVISIPYFTKLLIDSGYQHFLKVVAVIILFFDPAYWIWEYLTFRSFNYATTLPLYLCSLFWLLMPFAAFLKEGKLKQIAMANIATVGLISGVMGFVLNYHIDVYPIISFVGIRTLLYHYLMMFVAYYLWRSQAYQALPGDQVRAFIPVWILLIPSLVLNRFFQYDYGYTNGGQGTALVLLSERLPRPVFLFVLYALFFIFVWAVFYRNIPLSKKPNSEY